MTTQECNLRDHRNIDRIESMFRVHDQLCQYTASLQITIENTTIVLSGELPSPALKAELVPAIRRAGVLSQICDRVQVVH